MAEQTKRPSIFQKVIAATDAWLDTQISKGRGDIQKEIEDESDLFYRKSVAKDQSFFLGTQGYAEKPYRLTYDHLKQMALKDSIISAIIQTRQNQVSGFSKLVHTLHERGFRINIKNEQRLLEEIKAELRTTPEFAPKNSSLASPDMSPLGQGSGYSPADASEDPGSDQSKEDLIPGQGRIENAMDRQEIDGEGEVKDAPEDTVPDVSKKKKLPEVEQDVSNLNVVKGMISDDDEDNVAMDQTEGEILQDINPMKAAPQGEGQEDEKLSQPEAAAQDPDEAEAEEQTTNWRMERKARQILQERYGKRRHEVEQFIINCGKTKDRPFESKRWNFDSILRAWVRDSFTYDQFGTERVPDNANRIHHFVPVDGSTIRFSSPELGKYKTYPLHSNYDLIYPEKELEALKEKDALELDPKLLEANMYKWVQVIRGRIERAFTEQELKVGMRNPNADVFNNGYSISELELLVNLITSHLNTEWYNMAYFSQGFSAKGILYLKAPLNRRKIETIRQQWQHMIKGSRSSFQTPIFAGMDEVKWIPLTQNHSDIEFQGWLQYLIKMVCAIYQIDPQEIGIGMKEEGSSGNGLSGDNTQEKIDLSRDKGLYPLLRFLENYINVNIIDDVDPDFFLEFVGLREESTKESLDRQKSEAEFKKTVNEIRAEDGLPPLPGMDDVILNAIYMQHYMQFSPRALKMQQQQQEQAMSQAVLAGAPGGEGFPGAEEEAEAGPEKEESGNRPEDMANSQIEAQKAPPKQQPPMAKSLRVEYYRLQE